MQHRDHTDATLRLTRCTVMLRVLAALSCVLAVLTGVPAHGSEITSPVGVWKTFDDRTAKARGIVRIYERDGKLFGRIERTFTPGDENRVCIPCTGDRKDQPIIGLIILRNMVPDGNGFAGGDILDPESGTVYHCKMHLEQDGTRLVVRGYIGFSLLGRSQTWQRQG